MHKRILRLAALVAGIAIGLLGGAPGLIRDAAATVNGVPNSISYVGNGATTAFVTNFPFQVNTDLVVTVAGITKALTTDYTVSGAGNATGTVTFTTAPANGAAVVITRTVDYLQKTSLKTSRTYDPASVEKALDKLAMGEQQLAAKVANPVLPSALIDATPITATGGVSSRQLKDWFGDVKNVRSFNAACDGTTDDKAAFQAAHDALPSTGGVVDARTCVPTKLGSTLTITKSGTIFLMPAGTVTLGTSQIVVAAGTNNVAIMGPVPFGAPSAGVAGTNLVYTGTGVAVAVGNSGSNTQGFVLQDVTILINSAGSAAIGLQLNRVQNYHLMRPRVAGLLTANTQVLVDLEGFTVFTGGQIDNAFLSNGNTCVLFGQNANANTLVNTNCGLPGIGTGIGLAFTGAAGGFADGNTIIGGDVENCSAAVSFDRGGNNQIFGLRVESCTNVAAATANSTQNMVFYNSTTTQAYTDSGAMNSFVNPKQFSWQPTLSQWRTNSDAAMEMLYVAGSTTAQNIFHTWRKWDNTNQWKIWKDTSENWNIINGTNGNGRLSLLQSSGNTQLSGEGSGNLQFNMSANSGTGGVVFGSGGASPTSKAVIDSAGMMLFGTKIQANLGTPANGNVVFCSDCTIANPCAGGGTGALAKRLNGVWVCN